MARIVFQSGNSNPTSAALKWGITRVGRAPDNDIQLEDPSISARHCEIELGLDAVLVRDCGSTNGTFIDGRRVQESRIEPGQRLKLGQVEAFIERSIDQIHVPAIAVEQLPQTVALDDGTLSCANHPDLRAYWRCPDCQKMYCNGCIHEVRMVKGPLHRLCPKCSREVGLIVWDDDKLRNKSLWNKIKSLWTRP